ncbi:motility-associated protein Scm1 [Spiroplasma endosymbiont of Amphibalanus improvisus]|uniref:motility-associated protein Scm1 n=1 Tax=Spiroplasma endosymbiont of Amphibalanus improvisus TaxID=3066327 RepID=UPI00313EFEBE
MNKQKSFLVGLFVIFLFFLIFPLAQYKGLNESFQNSNWISDISNIYTTGFQIHPTNLFQFLNVTFGLSCGVGVFFNTIGNVSLNFFIVSLYFISPILGTILFFCLTYYTFKLFFKKMPEWKTKRLNQFSTVLCLIGGILALLSLFLGLIFIYSNDLSSLFLDYKNKVYVYNNALDQYLFGTQQVAPNSMNFLTTTLFNDGVNGLLNSDECTNLFKVGTVLLIFITPILFFIFAISSLIKLVSYLNLRYDGRYSGLRSRLKNWLLFTDIASSRELRKRLFSNAAFWISGLSFTVAMIFPALVPNTDMNRTEIILFSFSIILFFLSFTPIFYMIVKLKQMKSFAYNLIIFIQILSWIILTFIWQIILWILYGGIINNYPMIFGSIMLMLFSITSIISFSWLVYSRKR